MRRREQLHNEDTAYGSQATAGNSNEETEYDVDVHRRGEGRESGEDEHEDQRPKSHLGEILNGIEHSQPSFFRRDRRVGQRWRIQQ